MKKIVSVSFLLLLFTSIALFPQNRGEYSFAQPPAPPLMQTISQPSGHYSSGGLGSVGGISFDKAARPSSGLSVSQISFQYDPLQADGNRLHLEINHKQVAVPLYDWMLIPVAKYANSGYNSCFTYFGTLVDKEAAKHILENDGHILNYHPDFYNTLLGLRLADMDLLFMYNFTVELPESGGKYILGGGEPEPSVNSNKMGFNALVTNRENAINKSGQSYRSYLICDYKQDISFSVIHDSLEISGNPYYYCWRYASDKPGFDGQKNLDEAQSKVDGQISSRMSLMKRTKRDATIDLLLDAVERYEDGYSFYEAGTIVDLTMLPSSGEQRRQTLEQYTTESVYEALVNLEAGLAFYQTEFLEKLSDRISKPELFKKANPHVWNATVYTLRYSAFFRYLRQNFPQQWNSFITSIQNVDVEPHVTTPTVMYSTDNEEVKKYLYNDR